MVSYQLLDVVWRDLPKNSGEHKATMEQLQVALDEIAASAELPPNGTTSQVDAIVNEVFRMVNADDRMTMQEEVFKKTLTEILDSLMLQLEENPILFSSNSVVHEPLASSALDPSSSSSPSSVSSQGESIN